MSGRHHFDHDGTPEFPLCRVYPAIPWMPGHAQAIWVRDDGVGEDMPTVGPFHRGASHAIADDELDVGLCDICKRRRAFRFDDFFGNVCPLCEITHPLRYKARGVNPWGGGSSAGLGVAVGGGHDHPGGGRRDDRPDTAEAVRRNP